MRTSLIVLCLLIALPVAWADVVVVSQGLSLVPFTPTATGDQSWVFLNKPASFAGAPGSGPYQPVKIDPVAGGQDIWANPAEAGLGAEWISFADTSHTGTSPANDDISVTNPSSLALFFQNFHLDSAAHIMLSVWADDTTGVYLYDNQTFFTTTVAVANFAPGSACAGGVIGCIGDHPAPGVTPTGGKFDLGILGPGDYNLEFDTYQIAGDGYGILYGVNSVPEPSSILLFGTLIVGFTTVMRRRSRRSI